MRIYAFIKSWEKKKKQMLEKQNIKGNKSPKQGKKKVPNSPKQHQKKNIKI